MKPLVHIFSDHKFRVGRLWHPPKALDQILSRYVRPILFDNGDPTCIGRGGTCTLVTFKNRRFAITAHHALDNQNRSDAGYKNIFIPNLNKNKCLPISGITYINASKQGEEISDLCFLEIPETESPDSFFEMENTVFHPLICHAGCSYPRLDGWIDYDAPHIHTKCFYFDLSLDGNYRSNASNLQRFFIPPDMPDLPEYDGMSGGAVFGMRGSSPDYVVGIEGIIVRAGNRHVYAIDQNFLVTALQRITSTPTQSCPAACSSHHRQRG